MAAGPCWRRGRVVRRYMPMRIQHHRLYVKAYSSMHVSMYFELFRKGNAVNTGVPCPKVPIHRKLGLEKPAPVVAASVAAPASPILPMTAPSGALSAPKTLLNRRGVRAVRKRTTP